MSNHPPETGTTDELLSIGKAAEYLRVSPSTLRNWDQAGRFKAVRHPINNYRLYRISDLDRLLSELYADTPND